MIYEESVVTAKEQQRFWELIRNPIPGSKIAAALEFGIDLTLNIENLQRTPTERLRKLEDFSNSVEELQRGARDSR
jgi:hypothetical protein